ncbi:MAG: hypothetical protein ACKVHO_16565 [Verrucomicrobiia bacterium]|jgi:hypothetical protein
MNRRFTNPSLNGGFMLVQALVYIPIMAFLIYVAIDAALTLKKGTRGMQSGATRVTTAMNAGELWRADIRRATRPPQITNSTNSSALTIDHGTNSVVWSHAEGQIWRQADTNSPRVTVMRDVFSSDFHPDERKHVSAWNWDLELNRARPKAKTMPLYSFIAVPRIPDSK